MQYIFYCPSVITSDLLAKQKIPESYNDEFKLDDKWVGCPRHDLDVESLHILAAFRTEREAETYKRKWLAISKKIYGDLMADDGAPELHIYDWKELEEQDSLEYDDDLIPCGEFLDRYIEDGFLDLTSYE